MDRQAPLRNTYALVCATALWQILAIAPAQAETTYSAVVSAGGGFSTNPYQNSGKTITTPSVTLSVNPTMVVREATSTFRLSGTVTHVEYLRRYKASDSASVTASYDRQLSERTSLSGVVGFSTSILGNYDSFELQPVDPGTGPVLPPIVDDIAQNGTRQRRNSFSGSTRLMHSFSERDQVSVEVSGVLSRYPNPRVGTSANEYDHFNSAVAYSRVINDRLSLGASFSASRANYLRSAFGDSTTFSPQATAQFRLSSRVTLSGALGLSHTRTTLLGGTKDRSNALSGSLNGCYKLERSNICLTASRAALPSSFNGTRTQTSFGLTLNQRIDDRTVASGWVNYSRASQPFAITSRTVDFVSTGASISRRLSERLSAFVSTGFADTYQSGTNRRATIQANAGLRLALGVLR